MLFRFADFALDEERLELTRGGVKLAILPQSRDVLLHLLKNRQRVVSKRELVDAVWGSRVILSETVLAQAIMRLRRSLDDDPEQPRIVETVRGRGYRMVANVTEHEAEVAAPPRPFVGRASALAAIGDRFERAAGGRGSIAVVAGEPGIGKTRLIEELAARFKARGARVALAAGYEQAPSLWMWTEAARALAGQLDVAAVLREMGPFADDLISVLPELGPEHHEGAQPPAPAPPFQLFQAFARFFKEAARTGEIVVLIDDLQAGDPDSFAFLKFLSRAIDDARVLVVVTYRPAPLAADDALGHAVGALVRADPTCKLTLGALAPPDIAELARATLGYAADLALLRRLEEKTAGNPLLLTQLLHATRMDESSAASTSSLLDEGALREAIGLHLDGVSEPCRHALTLGAVLGRTFGVGPLSMMLGAPVPKLLETLDEALRARVITKSRSASHSYSFTHALVRDLLYKRLTASERIAWHHAAGQALLAFTPDPKGAELDTVAKHFVAAAGADVVPAIVWSVRAAEQAVVRADVDDAAEHLAAARSVLRLKRDVAIPGIDVALIGLGAHPPLSSLAEELRALLRPRN